MKFWKLFNITMGFLALGLAITQVSAVPLDTGVRAKEGSTWFVDLTFQDDNKTPVVPQSVKWWVADEKTEKILQPLSILCEGNNPPCPDDIWTIGLNPEANRVWSSSATGGLERHIVNVIWTYGVNYPMTDQLIYQVEDYQGMTVDCSSTCVPVPASTKTPTATGTSTRTKTVTPTP